MKIMVDLETLSTRMDAHVLTVGAVAFDSVTMEIKDTFYERVEPESCDKLGLHKCEETVKFWESQSKEAYDEAFNPENRKPILEVMQSFVKFWNKNKGDEFWCNGANFDEPILSTVFCKLGLQKPWKFWNVRCLRTLMSMADINMKMFGVVAHNSLEDCKAQLRAYAHAQKIIKSSRYTR